MLGFVIRQILKTLLGALLLASAACALCALLGLDFSIGVGSFDVVSVVCQKNGLTGISFLGKSVWCNSRELEAAGEEALRLLRAVF